MEFKGTPNKWHYTHRKQSNDSGMYSTEVFCENGKTIATLSWYPMPQKRKIIDGKPMLVTGTYREANALLISKSPLLLETIKNSIDELKEKGLIDLANKFDTLYKECITL